MKGIFGAIWEGWKKFAKAWGKVANTILLSIVYFTLFGITALIAIVSGQDLLKVRARKTESSVWEDWERKEQSMEECLRQS